MKTFFLSLVILSLLNLSCSKARESTPFLSAASSTGAGNNTAIETSQTAGGIEINAENKNGVQYNEDSDKEFFIEDFWSNSFAQAGIPESIKENILSNLTQGPDFIMELFLVLEGDPDLYLLVDKQHGLSRNYVPADLVDLAGASYRVTRQGLTLRKAAAESLEAMAAAAGLEGVILTAGSAYRSFEYQVDLYNRNVRELGQQAADRESARPGFSQHQLGLVVDFSPIDDSFALTPASRWLEKNAARFGWCISFPNGYEEATGYKWESWHFRYLGKDLAAFTAKYFGGIQQYCLQFIHAWINAPD